MYLFLYLYYFNTLLISNVDVSSFSILVFPFFHISKKNYL